jgi:hypothetical protein
LERRGQTRYGVRALAEFIWLDAWGVPQRGHGYTRDISLGGMFIRSDSQPPEKADLEVEVSFSAFAEASTNLRMSVKALVIRVETATPASLGTNRGFAILNKNYRLHGGATLEKKAAN